MHSRNFRFNGEKKKKKSQEEKVWNSILKGRWDAKEGEKKKNKHPKVLKVGDEKEYVFHISPH